jgi:hypothetical protein
MPCVFNQNNHCVRLDLPTDEKCKCPLYMPSYETCDMCGQPVLAKGVHDLDYKMFLCQDCAHKIRTCETCLTVSQCAFQTDPSPVPQTIQQTVRQGNMTATMPVKNPSRIEITCKKGCPCFDTENGCLRDYGSCGRWQFKGK